MTISDVRIKLVSTIPSDQSRLRAFASVTIDGAVVIRDLKIIHGNRGPFVAMPSRKLTDHCPACRHRVAVDAHYCSSCGTRLADGRIPVNHSGRAVLHADIVFPVSSEDREYIESVVLPAWQAELEAARVQGAAYQCGYDWRPDERCTEKWSVE